MGAGPITFSYDAWVQQFPELAGVSSAMATNYFTMATMFVSNTGCTRINDPVMLTTVLNLTTAHIAKLLSQQTNGVPTTGGAEGPSGAVGRPDSATEGSVTVSLDMGDQPPNAAWWDQTQYGAMAWAMLKPYRTFAYVRPTRRRVFNPPARYWGNGGFGI